MNCCKFSEFMITIIIFGVIFVITILIFGLIFVIVVLISWGSGEEKGAGCCDWRYFLLILQSACLDDLCDY